jgi:two-component system CheB/CheR fusion protein
METIQQLLAAALARPSAPATTGSTTAGEATIYIIDDDDAVRHEMGATFQAAGMSVASFPDGERFLAALPAVPGHDCLIVDAGLPGLSGLQLLEKLSTDGIALPAIMITGRGDIAIAVQAMKAGAADFLEKPTNAPELLACVERVLNQKNYHQALTARQRDAARQIAGLTARQRQVMERVLAGHASKNIAADLGISQRTVENHRASIMIKTGAKSIPALARLAVAAAMPSAT